MRNAVASKVLGQGLQFYERHCDCVMDVIAALAEDRSIVVYIDPVEYCHVGVRQPDPRVIPSDSRALEVVDLTSADDRLNVDFVCKEHILVRPAAGRVGSPTPAIRLRNFVVILAGQLHHPSFKVALSSGLDFDLFKMAGVLYQPVGNELIVPEAFDASVLYEVKLPGERNLPPVTWTWSNPKVMNLLKLLREEEDLKVKVKYLEQRRDAYERESYFAGRERVMGHSVPLYESKGQANSPFEYYEAPCLQIRLLGYAPHDCRDEYGHLDAAETYRTLKSDRRRLATVRYRIRAIVHAMKVNRVPEYENAEFVEKNRKNWSSPRTFRHIFLRDEHGDGDMLVKEWVGRFKRSVAC